MLPDADVRLPVPPDHDLHASLAPLRQGPLDPTWHLDGRRVVHAFLTPEGAATLALDPHPGSVHARAWGPGSTWLLPRVPDLLGARDDPAGFRPREPRLAALARSRAGARLPLHPTPLETLLGVILEQRVAWRDAVRSWRLLCRALGEPAPGPWPLVTAPDPVRLAATGYAHLHPLGIEQKRAGALREAARRRSAIDRLRDVPSTAGTALQALPGVGPWTAAMVAGRAFGDADAVPLGDLNLPSVVAWVLEGVERADDARMLELLEPFRPHRWRVLQLLLATATSVPRTAPRRNGRWLPGA